MIFVFAVTTQSPWPEFAHRQGMPYRLMSYAQLRRYPDLLNMLTGKPPTGTQTGRFPAANPPTTNKPRADKCLPAKRQSSN